MVSSFRGCWSLPIIALSLSCSGSPTEVSREPITLVVVDPESATLETGATLSLEAFALDTAGKPKPGRQMFWASNDERIATVSSTGVVTARAVGQAQIAVSAEGKSAISRITVIRPAVATVSVTPGQPELLVGETAQLRASTRAADGSELEDRDVSWSTSASSVATVSSSGMVTARAPGKATITATVEGKEGTSSITVRAAASPPAPPPPPPSSPPEVHRVEVVPDAIQISARNLERAQLRVRAYDAQGKELSVTSATWRSSDVTIAHVTQTGLVTALRPGNAVITATVGGKSGQASVSVNNSR